MNWSLPTPELSGNGELLELNSHEIEPWKERNLYDELSPQGQLFDTWHFTDYEAPLERPNAPRPSSFLFEGKTVSFGAEGIGTREKLAIENEFSWAAIFQALDTRYEDITQPCSYGRFRVPGLGEFLDGPGSFGFGEWFTQHHAYSWERYNQHKLPI